MSELWRLSRPDTLPITVTACALGLASAFGCGHEVDGIKALAALLLALLCHAAANVLQSVDVNAAAQRQARQFAWAVLAWVAVAGMLLALKTGGGLLLLGLAGLTLIWACTTPAPRALARRLRPALAVLVWWLVVLGADYMGRQHFFLIPALTAASFALLVGCAALASPELAQADGEPDRPFAAWPQSRWRRFAVGYALLALAAYAGLVLGVAMLYQPTQAVWGLLSLPFSAWAAALLWRHGDQPQYRQSAGRLSLVAAHLHGLAMAGGLVLTMLW